MNNYETVCIVKPDVGDDVVKGIVQKATSTIESGAGEVKKLEEWGRRRLAYSIGKKNDGYYFIVNYLSSPETSKELERLLRLNENVLRYQTVRVIEKKAVAVEAQAEPAKKVEEVKGGENG